MWQIKLETWTYRCFSQFLSTELLQLCDVVGLPPMNCLLRSFHNILIGLRSGLWLGHSITLAFFFFNHSLVTQLVCLGSLSCCVAHFLLRLGSRTDVLTFSFRTCYNSEFIVPSMMAGCPGQDEAKQAQTMILPPPCFTDGIRFLCWNTVCAFSKQRFSFKQKFFLFICQQNLSPTALCFPHDL